MSFTRPIAIEFGHCDPAGIVFYPRYFEMLNATVEQFFAQELHWSFANIRAERGNGVPTVSVKVDFHAPSRVDDLVEFTLVLARLGGASATFDIRARCGAELRIAAELTLCWIEAGRAKPWPPDMRARLLAHLRPSDEETSP